MIRQPPKREVLSWCNQNQNLVENPSMTILISAA